MHFCANTVLYYKENMKKILVFLVIVALIAVCWILFFSDFDTEEAQKLLQDNNFTVASTKGSQFVEDGILKGDLAKYASSVGDIVIATNIDEEQIENSDVLVSLEITDVSIITDLAGDLMGSGGTDMFEDVDTDALEAMADSYPEVDSMIEDLAKLDASQRDQLMDSLSYKIVGNTLIIGTDNALSIVK